MKGHAEKAKAVRRKSCKQNLRKKPGNASEKCMGGGGGGDFFKVHQTFGVYYRENDLGEKDIAKGGGNSENRLRTFRGEPPEGK